ncbi:MAG: hypothetical protein GYB68_01410 [Chloroflexi bacterium]|nr:hypothetical protein [Chloroflexota bacterium]
MMKTDPFDRVAIISATVLALVIAIVILFGDQVGVPIVDYGPVGEASQNSSISLTFAQPMARETAEERFSISPNVEGEITWAGNTLIFQPVERLTKGETYQVTLEEGATNQSGRATIQDFSWTFEVRESQVLYLGPADTFIKGLWVMPIDGGEPRPLYQPDYGVIHFAPSPDGSQIAMTVFTEDQLTEILLIDADGSNPQQVVDCGDALCGVVDWSPNGDLLAYEKQDIGISGQLGNYRIWLADLETGDTAPIFSDNQVLGYGPQWSPDGDRIAFFDSNPATQAIKVLDRDELFVMDIPTPMGKVGSFDPDGERMVYTAIKQVGRQYYPELRLAELSPDGENIALFEDGGHEDQFAVWSPDGEWIAFGRRRLDRQQGGNAIQILLYDVLNDEVIRLTEDAQYNATELTWDETSRYLLATRYRLETNSATSELWLYDMEDGSFERLTENGIAAQWLP